MVNLKEALDRVIHLYPNRHHRQEDCTTCHDRHSSPNRSAPLGISRRRFLGGTIAGAVGLAVSSLLPPLEPVFAGPTVDCRGQCCPCRRYWKTRCICNSGPCGSCGRYCKPDRQKLYKMYCNQVGGRAPCGCRGYCHVEGWTYCNRCSSCRRDIE